MSTQEKNYVYMLRCGDGSLYTGWTNDLDRRVRCHQDGRGAKYTKAHRPVELVYSETFDTRGEAMSREWQIKHMTKEHKEALVRQGREEADDTGSSGGR
ncbi:MAG: GIY-YIG nuclease family protein [Lachnospiraceae bacterium]|jgi:putative endonuclease|nr:GIY-YIG nuclease family protein [Lachnospiraceae bacterium]